MSWKQWPFHPISLTDMIGPNNGSNYNDRFISILVSGCSELLGRALTVWEPEIDKHGNCLLEPDPENPIKRRPKFRRVQQINPRGHFSDFCHFLRDLPGENDNCHQWNEEIAHQLFKLAVGEAAEPSKLTTGYPCRASLIDQSAPVLYSNKPIAVISSGQFLPEDDEALKRFHAFTKGIINKHSLTEEQVIKLNSYIKSLETRTQFIDRYKSQIAKRLPKSLDPPSIMELTPAGLFLDAVREIQRIAVAQFKMHQSNLESQFRQVLRQMFPSSPMDGRKDICEQTRPIFEKIRTYFNADYLCLFLSPQQFISYETNPSLLNPFLTSGLPDAIQNKISHFNWRKARLVPQNQSELEQPTLPFGAGFSSKIWTDKGEVQRILRAGIKGDGADFFKEATILCQIYLSDSYRGVLVWGPFRHMRIADLEPDELRFIEEISELVMMRFLSLVQLSDSHTRTIDWGNVAALLAHYSRRTMTPVSSGLRIISSLLKTGEHYSKTEAIEACNSIELAVKFMAEAVRAPLPSFAATAESAYRFEPTSLNSLISECVALYTPYAREKSITFRIDNSVITLPAVEVDKAKIRDALGYVIDNAVKYSHDNKEVRIYAEIIDNHVRLTIEDFGQGIAPGEKRLIFTRLYQGQRSRKSMLEEGEGLGLFHARLICNAHKGDITCDCRSGPRDSNSSALEGYRVWFTFELPISQHILDYKEGMNEEERNG